MGTSPETATGRSTTAGHHTDSSLDIDATPDIDPTLDTDTTVSADAADPGCCTPLSGAALDEDEADELAVLMKALADPVRLRLLSLIAHAPDDEVCACDMATPLGRSQPTISHHLSVLAKAGLVGREQRGKWAWFRVRPERLAQIADAVRLPLPD